MQKADRDKPGLWEVRERQFVSGQDTGTVDVQEACVRSQEGSPIHCLGLTSLWLKLQDTTCDVCKQVSEKRRGELHSQLIALMTSEV